MTARSIILVATAIVCLVGTARSQPETTPEDSAAMPVDITSYATDLNEKFASAIPTTWRTGHATPRELPGDAVGIRENGFTISLPSQAPIATPTYWEGKLYLSGGFHSKEFYCIDAQTGRPIWGVDLDDDGPSSAVVENDIVVFNTESCTIFALDANTGEMLWSWWLGDPLMSTPTIHDGKVYTSYPASGGEGEASHVLACFTLETGEVQWQRWIDSDVMTAAVGSGDTIIAATFAGTVYQFDADRGTILSAIRHRATSAPVKVGNELLMTKRADADGEVREAVVQASVRGGRSVTAFDRTAKYLDEDIQDRSQYKDQGKSLDAANGFSAGAPTTANADAAAENIGQSNVATLQAFQGSRAVVVSGLTYNTMGDEIICVDPKTGDVKWKSGLGGDLEKVGGFLGTSPAYAGGEIIVATHEGHLIRFDAATGDVIEKYELGSPVRSQPAVVDGKIYVGTDDGKMICVDTRNGDLTGWTTWGGNSAHTGVIP